MVKFILKTFLTFLIFLIISGIDAVFIEPNLLLTKQKDLYLPNWDEKLDNLKIAVVSDLHIGNKPPKTTDLKRLNKITDKINSKNPDLIFILGDFDSKEIKNAKYKEQDLTKIFKKLNSKYGTYAVLGNHDYATPSPIFIRKFLKNADIKILENETRYIKINNKTLRITGFKDAWYFDINPSEILGKINTPTIVLMHNPDSFARMPSKVSLALSGHTHGGEINIPGLGSPLMPSEYGQRYRKGYIVEDNKHLYVTGGVATLSRMRFFNPPEIVILTLHPQDEKTKIINTKPQKGINTRSAAEKIYHHIVKFKQKNSRKIYILRPPLNL